MASSSTSSKTMDAAAAGVAQETKPEEVYSSEGETEEKKATMKDFAASAATASAGASAHALLTLLLDQQEEVEEQQVRKEDRVEKAVQGFETDTKTNTKMSMEVMERGGDVDLVSKSDEDWEASKKNTTGATTCTIPPSSPDAAAATATATNTTVSTSTSSGNPRPRQPPSTPGAFAVAGINAGAMDNSAASMDTEIPSTNNHGLTTLQEDATDLDMNLPRANLLDDSKQETLDLPRADPMNLSRRRDSNKTNNPSKLCPPKYLIAIALGLLVIVLAIVIPISLRTRKEPQAYNTQADTPDLTLTNTSSTTDPPVSLEEQLLSSLFPQDYTATLTRANKLLALLPFQTKNNSLTPLSPQRRALKWILTDPNLEAYSNYRIQQRFALATLFFATEGWPARNDTITMPSNSNVTSHSSNWDRYDNWLSYYHHECHWFFQNTSGLYDYPAVRRGGPFYIPDKDGHCNEEQQILEHLWLWGNGLAGTMPEEIYLMTQLKSISLWAKDEQLVRPKGIISTQIGKLTNLEALDLMNNVLTGTIPTEIGLLTQLEHLWAVATGLTGTIPTEFGQLTKLGLALIDNNDLTGTLPTEIGNMSMLRQIWLHRNFLTGTLPTEIGLLSSFKDLFVSSNAFHGTLPSELGLLKNAWALPLDSNSFSGPIPTEIGLLTGCERFHLNDNSLSGTIPSELGNLGNTTARFLLWNNRLTGSIPSELGKLTGMKNLWLDDNDLSGAIPSELGLLTDMVHIELRNNSLTGSIPSELVGLTKLTSLSVDDTLLSGVVPTVFCGLENLTLDGLIIDCELMDCSCPEVCVCGDGQARSFWR